MMDSSTPLISIILTTYNSEKVIEATLNGIIQQDFPLDKVELIIVDGGSKDGTLNIINKFIQENKRRFSDVKLVVHDRNYGVSKARNDGIKVSRGRYLLILDHDVVMPSSTIGALLQYLESMDGRVVAAIPLHNNLCGGILSKWEYKIRKGRVSRINAITSCALIRRELIDQIGLYDEILGPPYTVYEDIEFGARALAKGYEIHLLGIGGYEVIHNTCEETASTSNLNGGRREVLKSLENAVTTVVNMIKKVKSLGNPKYRYALKRYLSSSPPIEKLRWISYSIIVASLIPIALTSIFLRSKGLLFLWILLVVACYLDVLKQYWNSRIPHISIAYSTIAFTWRLTRSTMLLIPGPKRLNCK
jgi:glycosyltransferase involved in cell wall biosynthesis